MRNDFPFKGFFGAFAVMWVLCALVGLATSGLVLYILYRVATHPW